jgi:hypothetical protein
MLSIDQVAEEKCRSYLVNHIGDRVVRVLGEETLWHPEFKTLDLSRQHLEGYGEKVDGTKVRLVDGAEERLVVIVDMIDGSDLVERNFGNWCSAMIFFKRSANRPEIWFSMVHNADGTIYGADAVGTFLIRPTSKKGEAFPSLNGPDIRKLYQSTPRDPKNPKKEPPIEETRQIAICFYGQKPSHFSTIPPGFQIWTKRSAASDRLRIYNLAGNPMMVRLANGENIHAVFEHKGQFAHDASPGAYIGLQAGAHLVDLAGKKIEVLDLARTLLTPSVSSVRYVLACTEELALELAAALRATTKAYYRCSDCEAGVVAERSSYPPNCSHCNKPMIENERRGISATT